MKRIIAPAVFLGFVNLVLWIVKVEEPSGGLLINRTLMPILSVFILTMMVLTERSRRKRFKSPAERDRQEVTKEKS